jgi:hypothetical protein
MRTVDQARAVADAVLYEGYLLYPYRASSRKNQSRWQFGVLGPEGAASAGCGEEPSMSMQCLLAPGPRCGTVTIELRFLQLQVREVQRVEASGEYVAVDELMVDGVCVMTWDEATECAATLPAIPLGGSPFESVLEFPGGEDVEPLTDTGGEQVGRIVRRRWPLAARVGTSTTDDRGFLRLSVSVENVSQPADEGDDRVTGKDAAIHTSLIGAHLLLQADDVGFVSLLEPPEEAVEPAARCHQHRCFPVLAGSPGSTDVVLGAPIILYDYPAVAEQSHGALFDSTEIDEILTLRVMTMTEAEKAEARATDPRAADLIDRCDAMSDADLQLLHGILREPHAMDITSPAPPASFETGDVPWWDPAEDASVAPGTDAVLIGGVSVSRGSLVRVHPSRRSDAQDLFFADQVARVTAVVHDVDGGVHVGLVLVDDPATEMHDWYGRYFYFAPDELEPLPADTGPGLPAEPRPDHREESRA